MSRGLGKTQRGVKAALESPDTPLTIKELAAIVHGEPTVAREQTLGMPWPHSKQNVRLLKDRRAENNVVVGGMYSL